MVVSLKESFEKTGHIQNEDNLKKIFYEEKELQDIMKKIYQIKRNLKV